jgi:MFS family permease
MRNGAILPHHRYAAVQDTGGNAWYVLLIVTIVYALNIADRFVVNTLIDPIRRAFDLGDLGVGMLTGGAVALFYVTASVPIAMLGDRKSRKLLLVLAIAFWSALTYLCGISRSAWQFFASRVGVGIGEAGATPISQSLLSDMFPPASRSIAFTLFSLGSAAGAAAGAWMGGLLNDRYGWRDALIFFGLFGLPLAAIVGLTISEPARGRFDVRPTHEGSGLMDTLRFIGRQRALIHLFAGSSIVVFWSWGLLWWTPTFLLRTHGMSLASSGAALGLMHGIGGVAVTLGTVWIMKILSKKDPRYQVWYVAAATVVAVLPSFLTYWVTSVRTSIVMLWLFIPVSYAYSGPSYALAQNLVPASMRSKTCALILLTGNLANLIVAPVLIGWASDRIAPHLSDPSQSLRYALAICTFSGLWGAWHYFAAARTLRPDLERAGSISCVP